MSYSSKNTEQTKKSADPFSEEIKLYYYVLIDGNINK